MRLRLPWRPSFSRSISRGRGTTLGRGRGIKSLVTRTGVDIIDLTDQEVEYQDNAAQVTHFLSSAACVRAAHDFYPAMLRHL